MLHIFPLLPLPPFGAGLPSGKRLMPRFCTLVRSRTGRGSDEYPLWHENPNLLKSDSVKRHLSRRHLSVLNFRFNYIFDGGRPRRTNCTLTKAASIPARRQKARGFLDLFFDSAPHLEYFFQFFELSTKAAFAKAAFDTLQTLTSLK